MTYYAPIAWTACKQHTVTLNKCKYEYIAALQALQDTLRLCRLIHDFDQSRKPKEMLFSVYNQRVLKMRRSRVQINRRKHIDIQHYQ